jgi:hypothetical protein
MNISSDIIHRKNRFILFSALAGILIWLATFIVLVSFTEIAIMYNKLICSLAVLTFWLIKWYKSINQYLLESKKENRILIRFQAILKYTVIEVFHFLILISFLLIVVIFIEKYFN